MSQGEPAETVHALVSGRVKIVRSDGAGKHHLLAVRGSGDLLGEIAVLGDGTRSATVIAIDLCRTRVFTMAAFGAFCDECGLVEELTRHLVRRLREGEAIRAELAALPGRPRLLKFMLRLARSSVAVPQAEGKVDIGIGQTDLMLGVGLSKAKVAAELSRLKGKEAVVRSRAPIVVDVKTLAALAGE